MTTTMTLRLLPLFATIATLLAISACTDAPADDVAEPLPTVIEGWIEDDERPVVIITRAADLTTDISDLEQYIEKWCRVTIDDGTTSEILVGRKNDDYFPSFIYTSTTMRGVVGRTYRLRVEIGNETYESETTILPAVRIDSVRTTPTDDGRWQVHAYPHIDPAADAERHYKFFSRVNSETRYYSSFLGTFQGSRYDPTTGYPVNRGIHDTYTGSNKYSPLYAPGDTVRIKLCSCTNEGFDFWTAYENAVSLSGNMFFNVTNGCPSNIPGAKGYWTGYGTSLTWIKIPKEI